MSSEGETSLANNDEARMANVEGNSNVQMTKRDRRLFGISDFVIVSSFIIRISSLAANSRAGARV
jgi:hypothetical protein